MYPDFEYKVAQIAKKVAEARSKCSNLSVTVAAKRSTSSTSGRSIAFVFAFFADAFKLFVFTGQPFHKGSDDYGDGSDDGSDSEEESGVSMHGGDHSNDDDSDGDGQDGEVGDDIDDEKSEASDGKDQVKKRCNDEESEASDDEESDGEVGDDIDDEKSEASDGKGQVKKRCNDDESEASDDEESEASDGKDGKGQVKRRCKDNKLAPSSTSGKSHLFASLDMQMHLKKQKTFEFTGLEGFGGGQGEGEVYDLNTDVVVERRARGYFKKATPGNGGVGKVTKINYTSDGCKVISYDIQYIKGLSHPSSEKGVLPHHVTRLMDPKERVAKSASASEGRQRNGLEAEHGDELKQCFIYTTEQGNVMSFTCTACDLVVFHCCCIAFSP